MAILCSPEMAKAYADDLRRKLLQAHDRKQGSLRVLAEQFGVSAGWAWKISAMRRRTGAMERPQQRHGPVSRVTPAIEERLRCLVRAQPDVTLAELQPQLEREAGLHLSIGRLWLGLQNMGLRLKKSHSTRKNKSAPKSRRGGSSGGRR
jgi:transposase